MRSVYKGTLKIGAVKAPIAVYLTADEFGLPGHLYHEDCGGKVRQAQFCELHPELEEIVTYSGIPIGDDILRVGPEVRNKLLDRKGEIEFVSFVKSTHLKELLPHTFRIACTYQVVPYEEFNSRVSLPTTLPLFLDRMRVKGVFAIVKVSLSGMRRYAMLHHTGILSTLYYAEELREFPEFEVTRDKETSDYLDDFIKQNTTTTLPVFSLGDYIERVQKWIKNATRKANRKVKANA